MVSSCSNIPDAKDMSNVLHRISVCRPSMCCLSTVHDISRLLCQDMQELKETKLGGEYVREKKEETKVQNSRKNHRRAHQMPHERACIC